MSKYRALLLFTTRIVGLMVLSVLTIFLILTTFGAPAILDRMLFLTNTWHPSSILNIGSIERIKNRIQTYDLVRAVLIQNQIPNDAQDEIGLVVQSLLPFKRLLFSQLQVNHRSTQNSPLVWGLGSCDQVNYVAATALAQFFDRVEMVGIQGTNLHAGHSFGRVWLPKRQQWIYFDLWPDDIFILDLDKTAKVQILRRLDSYGTEKSHNLSESSEFIKKIYFDLPKAKPYLVFPKTALAYIIRASVWKYLPHPTFVSSSENSSSVNSDKIPDEPLISERILKIYLSARREQIFGNISDAIRLYDKFLSQAPSQSPITEAAKLFQASLREKVK